MKKIVFIPIILTSLFFSCTKIKDSKPATVIAKTPGTLITDSVASPVVTKITKSKALKIFKASPPTIVPLTYPYGVGVPSITNFNITDGLPNNAVFASDIDQQGNIWFATEEGISKYDGQGFTNYNSDNGMVSGLARDLIVDLNNNIWVAKGYGLCIFDGRHFVNIEVDKDNPGGIFINSLFEDNQEVIWVATVQGLYKYKDKTFTKYTTEDGLAGNNISYLIQDKKGDLLVTTNEGLNRYDGKSFTPYSNIPFSKDSRGTHFLFCDSKGVIWFNSGTGLLGSYDGKQIKMYTQKERGMLIDSRSPIAFLEDKNGNLWFGGLGELTKFDGKQFINYAPKANPEFPFQLFSLTEDDDGNIWAGTSNEGLYKIDGPLLTKIETPYGTNGGFALDKSGVKWVITWEGLGKYNPDHVAVYGNDILGFRSSSLIIDRDGNKWLTQYDPKTKTDDIVKFNDTLFTNYGKAPWRSNAYIQHSMEDDSNNIWFIGSNGAVIKFDGSSFSEFGPAQGLKAERIISIFQDSKSNIWFGSRNEGTFKFDGHRFTNYTMRDGLPHNFINAIAEDKMGNIWFATNGGATKFDGKIFTNYSEKNGLGDFIGTVKYDSINKIIWFVTHIGLASLKWEQVNDDKPVFQHYNPRTGFNFSKIRDFIIDKQGVLWVLDNGVLRFDYKSIKDLKPIPLLIKNIKLNNEQISWNSLREGTYPVGTKDSLTAVNEIALKFGRTFSDEDFRQMSDVFGNVSYDRDTGSSFIPVNLVLPIKNNNITFEFGSESTSFGKAIQYQYKLEGYDKNWSPLNSKTEASFGNMGEGNYTFHVKALSPFGSWSEASYSFKVLPHWYRTWWAYISYVFIIILSVASFIRWRTKALQGEKMELEEKVNTRTSELNESLENLKSTQAQLIQSEKMASLGELTAGIAHEIQNPLNFVNNFSELNGELIKELVEEASSETRDAKNEAELLLSIKENSEKINHHGKRAESIVKGMLEHSRKSTGVKEPTDINKLCDEFVRLSYHGLRAKDKDFNCDYKLDLDPNMPLVNVISQDIGRVILNILNNAFQACHDKNLLGLNRGDQDVNLVGLPDGQNEYKPLVSLRTKYLGDKIEISISDNGPGIPDSIRDKIFQPFFTTKPTGQGTGLGLSLSYDIVKAHGGKLNVHSTIEKGTEFVIQLPI